MTVMGDQTSDVLEIALFSDFRLRKKPSLSIQPEDTVIGRLAAIAAPNREMEEILNLHERLSLTELIERCDVIISKMARWFETAHLAVFTMEKNIKEDLSTNLDDMQSLDQAIATMEPMVALLTEVGDIIEEKHEEQEDQTFEQRQQLIAVKVSITKIQSEWSGLQHFLSSIKAELKNSTDKRELTSLIENVLLQIDDLATVIFQFQEQRHVAAMHPGTDLSDILSNANSQSSIMLDDKSTDGKDDVLLTEIDSKIEPLFNNIEKIYVRMTSQPPKDASGMLTRKYHAVQERWDSLQVDIDELKQELKEDRWLAVFRQVADQVNVMIDGLERTVAHCQTVIQCVRDWQASKEIASSPQHLSTFDKLSRTLKRSFPRLQHSSSSRQAESSYEANVPFHPPIDREKWNSTEKNFQSKYKYYTPAIDRMLAMVENGISTRITSTTGFVTQRHQVIMQRWQRLKSVMNQLLLHDLPEIGAIFSGGSAQPTRCYDPEYQRRLPSVWQCPMYKAQETMAGKKNNTPSSTTTAARSMQMHPRIDVSVTNQSQLSSSSDYVSTHHLPTSSDLMAGRSKSIHTSHESLYDATHGSKFNHHELHHASSFSGLRSSTSESSSTGSSLIVRRRSNAEQTSRAMKPAWNASIRAKEQEFSSASPLWKSESKTDLRGTRKSRIPEKGSERERAEASWMKPTKSVLLRHRSQSIDRSTAEHNDLRPKTPVARSKTPNPGHRRTKTPTRLPARPKSSLDKYNPRLAVPPHDRDRPSSSHRRSLTPSLIPRAKTPSNTSIPSLITRPRSSFANHSSYIPPVPSLPSYVEHRSATHLEMTQTPSSDSQLSSNLHVSTLHHSPPSSPSSKGSSPSVRHELRKKQSASMLLQRDPSPSRISHIPQPSHFGVAGPSVEKEASSESDTHIALEDLPPYLPDRKDPLDVEVANVVNASPIAIKCQRAPSTRGRYYFGNELSPSLGGGKKMYTCKLMDYGDRYARRNNGKAVRNKVLVRVGGGWQDLEMFLLEHASLMASDVVVKSFVSSRSQLGWKT